MKREKPIMIIEPGFPDHWKVKKLNRLLIAAGGTPSACDYLLRLWGACQTRKSQQFKGPADAIAGVCGYEGEAAQFLQWLLDLRIIEPKEDGYWVRSFEEYNAQLIAARESGRIGGLKTQERRRKALADTNKSSSTLEAPLKHPSSVAKGMDRWMDRGIEGEPSDEGSKKEGSIEPSKENSGEFSKANTFTPPRRQNLIDRKNPPFEHAGLLAKPEVQNIIKALLRYQEETHGRQYTHLQFEALMHRFEHIKTVKVLQRIVDECISKGYKNPVFPDQEEYR